ncbi:MAG: DNA alkylation repair protein, partial [Actinobacteria bacterium]|nr:DNA alkylation repair protein [Actinomycetota bacterium]
MATSKDVVAEIKSLASAKKAKDLQWFFKTGSGEYAEGDIFLGVMVPQTRKIAKKYFDLPVPEIKKLTESDFHEVRFCGLLIVVSQFEKAKSKDKRKKLFELYMKQLKAGYINNWDMIDVTGVRIGSYLTTEKTALTTLRKLAKSKNLWEKRMSVIFTFAFQKVGDPYPTLEMADLLLKDDHDLIHKAVGWALREVGKMDGPLLRNFLKENVSIMPRTMLRYSIEKFSPAER